MTAKNKLNRKPTDTARYVIGNDNGVTGSVAILEVQTGKVALLKPVPVFKTLEYTKTRAFYTCIDDIAYAEMLRPFAEGSMLFIERPMINPAGRWNATKSAIRCDTVQRLVLRKLGEEIGLRFEYVDSKQWQKIMLPSGLDKDQTKKASLEVGTRLFPQIKLKKDADALLIAEWARRTKLL